MPKSKKPQSKISPSTPTPDIPATPERSTVVKPVGFPVVGIGASAGGLAAFEAFFAGMPSDVNPGMAFVLVQHLAPDHKSILADLIRRYTRMEVHEVEDGMVVEPNCAYIIPPNRDMAFLHGALHLLEPALPRGQRLPIDFFFRSLASDQHERAIGIVLSGTGSDGALGVRAIKGEGGMDMAQTPASTEFDGMPNAAIATGLVDFELPVQEMAAQLIAYSEQAFTQAIGAGMVLPTDDAALRQIFVMLRAQTGHDFSEYKVKTMYRRIQRRMAVHQIPNIESYVKFLQHTPPEVETLFRDLLIGVTSFFRDQDVFDVLATTVVPALFANKTQGRVIRVWSAGCSTGEEVYSLAILLAEYLEKTKASASVQVFATDIDSRAIATARAGIYPASIVTDVSPERLARFFAADPTAGTYRVQKSIRDMLVFSEQDVIKDPPFSKLDLVICRNLLIYLGSEVQRRLMSVFHYALNPGGALLLGTSETVGEGSDLFKLEHRGAKLYRRRDDVPSPSRQAWGRFNAPVRATSPTHPGMLSNPAFPQRRSLRELAERTLLDQFVPVSALVNSVGDILYLHGRTGMYLEPAPGEAGVNNIIKMAREGLRRDLTLALHAATSALIPVRREGVRVKTNGHFTTVNLSVLPVDADQQAELSTRLFLVMLDAVPEVESPAVMPGLPQTIAVEIDSRVAALQEELRSKEQYLQVTHEELETSNEELKSSNEEMQSVNEELQSTNEELETAKEEMQSINEELATVNGELQIKLLDLGRVNNDLNNLMAGTGIATVFVDLGLRIVRFTPAAVPLINLIAGDIGRPVAHVVSNLVGYTGMVADVQSVLDTLVPREVQVTTPDGKWFTMRVQPYRTVENTIEGAVILFVDITEIVQVRERLAKANALARLAVVVRDANDAITVQDLTGRMIAWNPSAEALYGWSEAEALAMNVTERTPDDERVHAMERLAQLARAEILEPYRTSRRTQRGDVIPVTITSTALVDAAGQIYAIATTERAIKSRTESL